MQLGLWLPLAPSPESQASSCTEGAWGGSVEKRHQPAGSQILSQQSGWRRAMFHLIPSWDHPETSPPTIYI